jgi:hypothetical protein
MFFYPSNTKVIFASNIVYVRETIGRHILALEANPIVFCEAILPLLTNVQLKQNNKPSYSLDPDSPSKKRARRILDYE